MEKFDKTREATPKVKRAETRIPDELLEKEKLSLNAKVILAKVLGLWKNCNKEVYISNARLAQLLGGVSTDTVKRAKRELTDLKLIKIVQEEKGKGHLAHIKVAEAKVNAYLGFEYFQEEKNNTPAKKETTPQDNRRPESKMNNGQGNYATQKRERDPYSEYLAKMYTSTLGKDKEGQV